MAGNILIKIAIISVLSIVLAVNIDEVPYSDNMTNVTTEQLVANAFDGVYTECLLYLSYSCLQRKTLLYLNELDTLSEVTVVGDYLKFVKVNNSKIKEEHKIENMTELNSEDLSIMIDNALDKFFNGHVMKISAMGKDILMPNTVEEFVGRKRKGGGHGGGGGGHSDGGDGGKKKMMMMAMMCMKMKMMMMIPAMMGMMGMMSFKGMMFSMMSFMISKMMLIMKLLEKKNSISSGAGADPGWAAGGGGGAWMPAGPDYGGGGGGYDANAQWQQRSIIMKKAEKINVPKDVEGPIISYIKPGIRYNGLNPKTADNDVKIRKKRGVLDILQNAYTYWINKMLGLTKKKVTNPKMKVVNGMKYIYYPTRPMKIKTPKELQPENKPIIIMAEDFNKGEIMDIESRTIGKKVKKFMKSVNETVDENPWD